MRYLKITFSLAISLVLNFAFSKVQSQTIGPVNLNPVNSPYLTYCSAPITVAPPSQPVSLTIGSGDYEIYSNGSITMLPGFVAKTTLSSDGFYVAAHGTDLPEPEFFGVPDLNSVLQYEKMEVGISLPSLHARIYEFLSNETGDYKVMSNGYNTAFTNGDIINPYDPEHISVAAFFYHDASSVPIVRNGFFYKEYHRIPITPVPPNYDTHDWAATYGDQDNPDANEIDPFEWRIRFSPPETGSWKCMILVYVDGQLRPEHYFFKFNVIAGSDPGFVTVADNHQYLKFSNGDQFFPVGDNYAWPDGVSSCVALNCATGTVYEHKASPDAFIFNMDYIDKLTDAANGGGAGNHTRLIFAPYGYEIEFERLGNYQTRQIEMFELDKYLEYASYKDVYLSMSPLNGFFLFPDESGNQNCCLGEYTELFPWHPYNNEHGYHSTHDYDPAQDHNVQFKGIDGVTNNFEFFTNYNAKKAFKNKLRYMDARWGYSPNYYQIEISTEINQFNPDFWNPSNGNNTYTQDWIYEMADYLKNDLKVKQLTTMNYGATPKPIDPGGPNHSYSLIWNDANIDVTTLHDYGDRLPNLLMKASITNNALNTFNKPCLINEDDIQRTITICLSNCTEVSLHNILWSSAFTGSYGPGMHWEWRTELNLADEYRALRNLFSIIDLKFANGYTPHNSVGIPTQVGGTPFENFYLTKSGGFSNKAYGWVHNRSYNEYTFGGCMDTIMIDEDNDTSVHYKLRNQYENYWNDYNYSVHFPIPYQSYYKPQSTFFLQDLIHLEQYTIEYYYTSGPNIGQFEPAYTFNFTTNSAGEYTITNGPPTGYDPVNHVWYPADWAYVVHVYGEPRSTVNNYQWNPQKDPNHQIHLEKTDGIEMIDDISVAPNPNDGTFTVSIQASKPISGNVALMDVSGNVIQSQQVNLFEGLNRINFSNGTLPAGVYFIRVDGYDEVLKVVVTK